MEKYTKNIETMVLILSWRIFWTRVSRRERVKTVLTIFLSISLLSQSLLLIVDPKYVNLSTYLLIGSRWRRYEVMSLIVLGHLFLKIIVSSTFVHALVKRSIKDWMGNGLCAATTVLSVNNMYHILVFFTFVFAFLRNGLNSLPSVRVFRFVLSSAVSKSFSRKKVKRRCQKECWGCFLPCLTPFASFKRLWHITIVFYSND